MNQECKTCGKLWNELEFPKANSSTCKACRKVYEKEWRKANAERVKQGDRTRMQKFRVNNPDYVARERVNSRDYGRKHKERRLAYQQARQRANRTLVNSYKDKPCKDCGIKYPPHVMDFDHVTGNKLNSISAMRNNRPKATIIAEIEKCDLVCSNCHRIRTYNRRFLTPSSDTQ